MIDRRMLSLLLLVAVAVTGCDAVSKRSDEAKPSPEPKSYLPLKRQCWQDGVTYIKHATAVDVNKGRFMRVNYAYNPDLDTCLCSFLYRNEMLLSWAVVDIYTNQSLAEGSEMSTPEERTAYEIKAKKLMGLP